MFLFSDYTKLLLTYDKRIEIFDMESSTSTCNQLPFISQTDLFYTEYGTLGKNNNLILCGVNDIDSYRRDCYLYQKKKYG